MSERCYGFPIRFDIGTSQKSKDNMTYYPREEDIPYRGIMRCGISPLGTPRYYFTVHPYYTLKLAHQSYGLN